MIIAAFDCFDLCASFYFYFISGSRFSWVRTIIMSGCLLVCQLKLALCCSCRHEVRPEWAIVSSLASFRWAATFHWRRKKRNNFCIRTNVNQPLIFLYFFFSGLRYEDSFPRTLQEWRPVIFLLFSLWSYSDSCALDGSCQHSHQDSENSRSVNPVGCWACPVKAQITPLLSVSEQRRSGLNSKHAVCLHLETRKRCCDVVIKCMYEDRM